MAEILKSQVVYYLNKLTEEQLVQVCGNHSLVVREGKKSRRTALKNAVVRYLSSEDVEDSEDEGFALFTTIQEELKKLLGESDDVKDEEQRGVEGNGLSTNGGSSSQMGGTEEQNGVKMRNEVENHPLPRPNLHNSRSESKLEFSRIKLKDFKVHGGTVGGADGLDWNSLHYQIYKEGLDLGYTEREIMSGVIRAMKSGSSLRKYFEGKPSLTWETFMGVLKAHCNVVTASTLLDQMSDSVQEPKEDALDYILKMINMKDIIIETNKDEAHRIGTPHIKQKFTRAVDVGLRSPTTRLELKPLIYDDHIGEPQFLEEVKKVLARKTESEKKFGKKGKPAVVNKVGGTVGGEDESNHDKVLEKLTLLTDMAVENQRHVKELEKQIADMKKGGGNTGGKKVNFKFNKCAPCEKDKLYCTHCSKCGEGGHKRHACPKNE